MPKIIIIDEVLTKLLQKWCSFFCLRYSVSQSRSIYHFYRFKFYVSISQTALTSSGMMSGPNSLNLNPLDYQAMLES